MTKKPFLKKFKIGDRWIGEGERCFVIAEAGSNHDGNFEQALRLIDVARDAGADAVKFQTFRADRLYPRSEKRARYLKALGIDKSVYQVIHEMEMPLEWIPKLAAHCRKRRIMFLSTPFDEQSAERLDPYIPAYKIASYEMTHYPLIDYVARKGKPLLISTGGAKMSEVVEMVERVSRTGNRKLCVLQCTARYPAPPESLNLSVIATFKKKWDFPVGLSDHSREPSSAPLVAVALGANVLEKHFTLSRRLPGPDHTYALEPAELKEMVRQIRWAEKSFGTGTKAPHPLEMELSDYRRGIFTVKDVRPGERLDAGNTAVLRRSGLPETDLKPKDWERVMGKKASRRLSAYSLLSSGDVKS